MTSYMALLFTAFVYIPFGHILVPFLNFWHKTAQVITFNDKLPTKEFHINPARISSQMFYFTVTAQIVNFATEVVVPYVKRKAFAKAKEFQHKDDAGKNDHSEEVGFLKRVREECQLECYDVSSDYREMIIQYGEFEPPPSSPILPVYSQLQATFQCSRLLGHLPHAASS